MLTGVFGMQWGDEGKGKITHLLAKNADMVIRFNGGANAGHTVVDKGKEFGTHLIPAGVFYQNVTSLLASGMVVDIPVLRAEYEEIGKHLGKAPDVMLAENAHLVMPYHKLTEELEGSNKRIGTTRRGIGPAYRDKAARSGIRVVDLQDEERLRAGVERRVEELKRQWHESSEMNALVPDEIVTELLSQAEPFLDKIVQGSLVIEEGIRSGDSILFEGAQGALLDINFGTYPYVTSSGTTRAALPNAIGLPLPIMNRQIGITKAYVTRVGAGPFPTRVSGEAEAALREKGNEYGVTTGRPRDCGWLDLVGLKHAVRLNAPTELAITKLDVLSGTQEIKLCTAYEYEGKRVTEFPLSADVLERCVPVYETLRGWQEEITSCTKMQHLPAAARRYLDRIAEIAGVRIGLVSVGPCPEETILSGFEST